MTRRTAGTRAAALALVAAALALAFAPGATAAPSPPQIAAPSAIVVEASTGDVAYQRNADSRRAIASTTKLMTALLVLERLRLSEVVPAARYRALPIESKINLRAGERLTVADLLRGLLVESANDAAVTLAVAVSGSRRAFVAAMNARARELGLGGTHYANPIGLDDSRNYSTARDLVKLTLRLRDFPFFKRTVARPSVLLKSGDHVRSLSNRNRLVGDPWSQLALEQGFRIDGVKTGHTTRARDVLVASARRNGVHLVSAVLGASSKDARDKQTVDLLDWSFGRYRRAAIVRRGAALTQVPIRYRRGAELELVAGRTVRRVVRRGERSPYRWRLAGVPAEVEGPIRRGQRLGSVQVLRDGRRVATVPLVASAAVPEAAVSERTKDYFTRPLTLALILAALACTVLVARMGARRRRRTARQRAGEPETA